MCYMTVNDKNRCSHPKPTYTLVTDVGICRLLSVTGECVSHQLLCTTVCGTHILLLGSKTNSVLIDTNSLAVICFVFINPELAND